jgi:hypothetical protein
MSNTIGSLLLAVLGLATSLTAHADTVRCHVIYGGETWTLDAAPTTTPYQTRNQAIGRYFEFKLINAELPNTGRFVRIYTYAMSSGDPVLIHQASYRPPFDARAAHWGFTGLQYVYEPSKGSELQYWCQLLP